MTSTGFFGAVSCSQALHLRGIRFENDQALAMPLLPKMCVANVSGSRNISCELRRSSLQVDRCGFLCMYVHMHVYTYMQI